MTRKKDDLALLAKEKEDPRPGSIEYSDLSELDEDYKLMIHTDPKYSIDIDPTGRYNFDEKTKDLIKWMIQYRNVQFVSTVMMNIPVEEGIEIYQRYDVQSEIKRINMAMYARRFTSKMADLDALGGYLTSGLIDENVPIAERWSPKDKLTATKMLMTLNAMKKKGYQDPITVEGVEIQEDLAKLSPNDLKQLIEINDEDPEEKEALIDLINADGLLSMEEIKNLRMMSISELQSLVDEMGLEGDTDEEQQ